MQKRPGDLEELLRVSRNANESMQVNIVHASLDFVSCLLIPESRHLTFVYCHVIAFEAFTTT